MLEAAACQEGPYAESALEMAVEGHLLHNKPEAAEVLVERVASNVEVGEPGKAEREYLKQQSEEAGRHCVSPQSVETLHIRAAEIMPDDLLRTKSLDRHDRCTDLA